MNRINIPHVGTDEPDDKQRTKKITPFDMVRAASTVIIFGVPLIVGTAAILGYGAYKAYEKLKR
jgi:hypothetical protein